MAKKHILIVDDEEDIATMLKLNLEADGFTVSTLSSGDHVMETVLNHPPSIILLDVMMPEKDGFQVCKELKSRAITAAIPVIFLTAKTMEHNIVSGLEIGADDYITKPFSISVLISRIKAVLRRTDTTTNPISSDTISQGNLTLDTSKMTVTTPQGPISMNATEFSLLKYLITRPGWVFKRHQLMEACKGDNVFVTDRSIDVMMVSIRKKMGPYAHLIETVRGVGYKFKDIDH